MRFMAKVGDRRSDVSRGIADRLDRTIAALLRSKGAEAAKNNPTCDVLIVDRSDRRVGADRARVDVREHGDGSLERARGIVQV